MADYQLNEYESRIDLDICLAREIAAGLTAAIAEHGRASLAVSGGKTPVGMFQQLRQMRIDWDKVWITLVDDRWLPADHADSNERLVREHLLKYQVEAAHFVSLKTDTDTPEAGIADVATRIAAMPLPFDVVVLGMGEDGHTASLFPCASELESAAAPEGNALVAALNPRTAPYPRISLTLSLLARSRKLLLHLAGPSKKSVFEAAMRNRETRLPIAKLIDAAGHCRVYWAD
jgi:6-phosphogluconolactonase